MDPGLAGFALYVANFGSYNATYGSLAGVIVFLVWLWISNCAVLLGAEMNAEIERGRELESGVPEEETIAVEPRTPAEASRTGRSRRDRAAAGSTARGEICHVRSPSLL